MMEKHGGLDIIYSSKGIRDDSGSEFGRFEVVYGAIDEVLGYGTTWTEVDWICRSKKNNFRQSALL